MRQIKNDIWSREPAFRSYSSRPPTVKTVGGLCGVTAAIRTRVAWVIHAKPYRRTTPTLILSLTFITARHFKKL